MPIADVELTIARRVNGTTTVSMRVELPHQRVDPVRGVPVTITDTVLAALAQDLEVYGATLTAMVFPPALREAWREARGYADGRGEALRVRLALEGDDSLHAIRWELLRDPLDSTPLAYSEHRRLSRFLPAASYRPLQLPARPELHAVVAVASPSSLSTYGLPPVDINGEVGRAQQGLGDIPTAVLDGQEGRPAATLPAIAAALRGSAHILYLVCHGALIDGKPYLWLEHGGEPVAGDLLVQTIVNLERRPLLIVLASCQGAGDTYQMLTAIGPKLAQAGVGAVMAIQGNVPMELIAQFTPPLFAELRRDGQIDRALAAARAALPNDLPWWMPALWMAVRDGALWIEDDEPPFVSIAGLYPPCHTRVGHHAIASDLHTRLLAAKERQGSVVVLDSPPGYGKFALVRELAIACTAFSGVVLAIDLNFPPEVEDSESPSSVAVPPGLTDQLSAAWPRGAAVGAHWLHLMAQAQRALGRPLVPGRTAIHDNPGALVTVLAQIAASRPMLLVLEHWERASTLWDVLLGELMAAMRPPLQLLVVLTRDRAWRAADEESSTLGQGIARGAVVRHALRRVSSDDLAAAVGPAHLDLIDRLHSLSGGHPALAMALWEEWQAVGAVTRDEHGVAQPTSLDSPWVAHSMRELVTRLLHARLGVRPPIPLAQIRRALVVAALEGPVFTVPAVAEVVGIETNDLLDLCDDYLLDDDPDARILVEIGPVPQPEERVHVRLDRYSFALPYLRLIFARELDDIEQKRDALSLAESLERHYQPAPERIAGVLASLFALGDDEARAAPYRERDERVQRERAGEEALRWTIESLDRQGLGKTGRMINAHLELAMWLYERTRYVDAVQEARAAVILADKLGERLHIARACSWLGLLLRAQGDLAGARPYYERALAIYEQVLGPQHPDTASSLNNLGALLHAQGELASARPYYERALAIREQVLGPQHLDTALSLNSLGYLLDAQGELASARHYYERALAIREQVLGPQHPQTASSLNNLGALLRAQGELASARPYYERALAIREQVLGPQHPDTAQSLNNLGYLLQAQGELASARPYFERALAIREQVLGPQHPDTAQSLNNLGALLQAQGELASARPYFERALAICEQVLGPQHPDTALTFNNLGVLLHAQGELASARLYYERALAILVSRLGPRHPYTETIQRNLAALDTPPGTHE
jgi:Tfp pilus assembly protein PilF